MSTVRLLDSRLGLRNSTTRIPFRYGTACLTKCPQAVFQARIEIDGRAQVGFSGDCLPPSWFDKAPEKDFARQIREMIAAISHAENLFALRLSSPGDFFSAWRDALDSQHRWGNEHRVTPLLLSFGVSLVERAIIDAICRWHRLPFAKAIRTNVLGIQAGTIHQELIGLEPRDWLPSEPLTSVFVRHTIGLADPLTTATIPPADRLNDQFPQAFEEYVEQTGVRYFKVKVSNQLERDLERMRTIAAIVERKHGADYACTLDGNELYKKAAEFDRLIEAIHHDDQLRTLWNNVLAIEQPLERSIALDPAHTDGIRELGKHKPVIIDESDGELDSYQKALALGYRGVSSKNCKGTIKSLLNAGLTWMRNRRGEQSHFIMTGEDLCSVGIVPTQADLCLAATLGLTHVERNGHHYHPGLSYLPERDRQEALVKHADFYAFRHGRVTPNLVDGRFEIGSLQCVGFGFAVEPDMRDWQPASEWDFASLDST